MKATEKQAIKNWFSYHKDLAESTHIDVSMSYTDIQLHKAKIERDPIEWMTYFFPKYASYPFAPFQRMAVKRIVENKCDFPHFGSCCGNYPLHSVEDSCDADVGSP